MILQRDIRLRVPIRLYGCYYMSLCYLANKWSNTPLSIARLNGSLYFKAIQDGWMNSDCYIKHPSAILRCLEFDAEYTGVHEAPDYECKEDEVEILRFEGGGMHGHFVVGDGHGHVAYDPYGVSKAVTDGVLVSKRIFRRE